MDQKTIMELLKEAVNADGRRFNQIQVTLGRQIYQTEDGNYLYSALFNCLIVNTYRHNRQGLPALFPVVALLCGDRDEGVIISSIDWDVHKTASEAV